MRKYKSIAIFAMLAVIATTAIFVGCEKKENPVVEQVEKQKIHKYMEEDTITIRGGTHGQWDRDCEWPGIGCLPEIIVRPMDSYQNIERFQDIFREIKPFDNEPETGENNRIIVEREHELFRRIFEQMSQSEWFDKIVEAKGIISCREITPINYILEVRLLDDNNNFVKFNFGDELEYVEENILDFVYIPIILLEEEIPVE